MVIIITILFLLFPSIVGLILTFATNEPVWILVCNFVTPFILLIISEFRRAWNRSESHTTQYHVEDIDEYTNKYGEIKWWHED